MNFRKLKLEEFDEYYDLILDNFSLNEIRTYETTKKLVQEDNIVEVLDDNGIIGAISYYALEDYIFLEYLVIDKVHQSNGLGTKLLHHLIGTGRKIILEVELPTSDNNIRRINFYKRNGFKFNEQYYYEVGPINETLNEKVEFKLMSFPNNLSDDEFKTLYKIIEERIY